MSIKYANQVLDFLDEKVANNIDLGFSYEEPAKAEDYALILKIGSDIVLKKYPINNPINAAFSLASYEKNAEKLTPEMRKIAESNIARTLDLFGLEHKLTSDETVNGNVYHVKKADEAIEKKTPKVVEYALEGKLPITNAKELSKSASEFIKQKHFLSISDRKKAAFNMVKKAEELNVNLPTGIYEYSSYTPGKFGQLKTAVASRMTIYPKKIAEFVGKMLESVKTSDDVVKVAEAIDNIDSKYHIRKLQHIDLAKGFFTTEKPAEEKEKEKIARAIESDVLDDYLEKESIELLKESSYDMAKLDSRSRTILKKVLSNIQ